MTMRLAPPGRTSSSARGVVQGAGANHCFSNSGSVHARKAFSRGASMMRVSESSRPVFGVAAAGWADIDVLLRKVPAQNDARASQKQTMPAYFSDVELTVPVRLEVLSADAVLTHFCYHGGFHRAQTPFLEPPVAATHARPAGRG